MPGTGRQATTEELTAAHFADFVAEAHGGRRPFPWQQALLDRILTDGRWPDVIDVPTGLGKTTVLDVAVFVAALRPDLAPRRTFFVVDRRLVVDEAHEHATAIREALTGTAGPVCRAVADRLRAVGDPGEVLTVARMRGGVTWDRVWLERPDRHAIITGTIDQVGSRLLFRGYGVSEYARSIDAALVGTDSLIVVDEAHLATAFHTTVREAFDLDRWPIARRPVLITMSATNPADDDRPAASGIGTPTVHTISTADLDHPDAGQRLRAGKRLRLVQVDTNRRKAATEVPQVMADLAARLADRGVVAVVANTVARARAVPSPAHAGRSPLRHLLRASGPRAAAAPSPAHAGRSPLQQLAGEPLKSALSVIDPRGSVSIVTCTAAGIRSKRRPSVTGSREPVSIATSAWRPARS
ncbi:MULTISPECIES: DEAD/DEAH box helicase family protein [unclassified Micromonospora]|uniref:DEAD/DEAH box helicase family protein n=1 Tax=unclassified Micromonospora TaxID=2617518 RepID=UPI003A84B199